MSLSEAREIAREWREDLRRGIDPKEKEADRLREQAQRRADTFESTFEAFADDHLTTLRTGAVVKASIINHVFPLWRDRPVKDIKRADVIDLMRQLKKVAPIGSNRILAYLKRFFGWCIDQALLEASPAAAVKKPSKENQRDRYLTESEIRAIWLACERAGVFGRAFQLMLALGQRRGEIGAMKWSEIDLERCTWSLSRDRTKANRAHDVPLSPVAMDILNACPRLGDFVFATGRGSASISGWGKAKKRVDALAAFDGGAIAEWHLHDLRRTCATYLAKLGTDRIIISKVLNHAEGGVTGIYDRHAYEAQKRHALEAWGKYLIATISNEAQNNVLQLRARSA